MSNKPRQAPTKRKPDCVTEVRVGNTTLIVKGYFKQDATETAADKMIMACWSRYLPQLPRTGGIHRFHRRQQRFG